MEEQVVAIKGTGMEEIRKKTCNRLKERGLGCPENLPLLDKEVSLRPVEEIAKRVVVLFSLKAITVHPEDEDGIKQFLYKYYNSALSQAERDALKKNRIPDKDIVKFSWCSESLYTLLWACGIISDNYLQYPSHEIDIPKKYLNSLPPENSFSNFLSSINLRDEIHIVAELDFYYNLHWIVKHPDKKNTSVWSSLFGVREKNNLHLNESVILERRKALEWIVYRDQEWDLISLDT